MRCDSHFPGHFSTVDLNSDANNGKQPLDNNADGIVKNEDFGNHSLRPLPSRQLLYLLGDKDVTKQTILRQEARFRDQVRELHRLYWRQKELMDEVKRNNPANRHHLNLETLRSNLFLFQASHHKTEKSFPVPRFPCTNPAPSPSSVTTSKNSESLTSYGSESKCTMIGKKILDLSLPPEEYFDSEDEKSMKTVTQLFGCPLTIKSEDLQKSGSSSSVNPVPGSNSSRSQLLDLNEPIDVEDAQNETVVKLREEEGLTSGFSFDLNEPVKLSQPLCDDEAGQNEVTPPSSGFSQVMASSSSKGNNSKQALQNSNPSSVSSSRKSVRAVEGPKVVLALPCLSAMKSFTKGRGVRKNVNSGPVVGNCGGADIDSTKGPVMLEKVAVCKRVDGQSSESSNDVRELMIDLNSCIANDHESSLTSSCLSKNLVTGLLSSQNKDIDQPGGELGKTKVEENFQVLVQEDSVLQQEAMNTEGEEELVKIAAKTLVSISSPVAQTRPKPATYGPDKPVEGSSLERFADVALSETNMQNSDRDKSLFFPKATLDYFELMTLKLTEINVVDEQDHHNVSIGPKDQEEDEIGSATSSLRQGQRRRGRPRGKNSKSDILPSISSPSRSEVSQGVQKFRGIVDASKNNYSEMGHPGSARRRGTRLSRLRESACVVEKGDCEKSLVGWNITKGRRRPRYPSSNTWRFQAPAN